ncbi:MAG: VOC family protein [Anaerolineales bacterium]|nr:MAG: VOC family protein [Anaerolineales bacterium]
MKLRLAVVSLWAEDVPTTAHFYRDVLGLPLAALHGHVPHFDLDGTYLVLLQGRPMPAEDPLPPRFPLIAFEVSDLDTAAERLREHGVEMPWGIEEDASSRWVMFHDPAGNLIELVQFNRPFARTLQQ